MLTRFEVSGFKNLHDVSVELGPFTCVAGPNSVGKSNLFDAVPTGLSLHLSHERLSPAPRPRLHFPQAQSYIDDLVRGRQKRQRNHFLSTVTGNRHYVSVRREEGSGRPREVSAERAQRTVLSATSSAEHPTMLAARTEMSSWRFVALEPSAMRAPDDLMERRPISAAGAHVPASLFRQSLQDGRGQAGVQQEGGAVAPVMDQVRDSLGSLVDVRSLRVVPDQARQTLELHAQIGETPELPARSLSDGTLRFIALSAMKVSPDYFGMLCMEEPENGIHPSKVIDMHALLSELSQPSEQAPRQVVVNTHSPYFVQATSDEDILCAVGKTLPGPGGSLRRGVGFHPLPGTWRARDWQQGETARPVSRGEIASFLENPAGWDGDD